MKIVYLLLHDFRFASIGLEEFAHRYFHFSKEYARRMARRGHEVTLYVLSNDRTGYKSVKLDGFEIKAFKVGFSFPPGLRFGNTHSLEALKSLSKDSPDVVHFHNYYLWSFAYAAPWVKRQGIPLVAQYHGTDPIRRLKGVGLYPSLRLCDRVLVPLESEYNFLKSLHISDPRVLRFPSTGVDTSVFHRVAPPEDPPLLLYVGRVPRKPDFRWEKSPQLILPILRSLRSAGSEAKLMVVGDGPGLIAMKSRAASLGVADSVEFVGELPHESLARIYSRASLTFVPFRLEEIGPYWDGALQESLACGTPPVGFNNGSPGFKDLGLMIPTDPGEAAPLVQSALDNDRWASSIRESGPRAIREHCDWDIMAGQLESIYAGAIRARG
jgi:glycosyltransferase involved in cell wall biosynthesis